MYIDKIIKREFLVLIVCVITLIALIIGMSYSFFFSVDSSNYEIIKTGDLSISYCDDSECNNKYNNYGNIIGMTNVNGENIPKNIYPMEEIDALNNYPYIFNIKNTGTLDSIIKIRLVEEENNQVLNDTYKEHLKVAISDCSNSIDKEDIIIKNYNSLENNELLNNIKLNISDEKTYCLWTWLDEFTPNSVQNSYFIASIDVEAEYKPKK